MKYLIIFLLLAIQIVSQNLLKGKVVNSGTGEPLPLANISVEKTNYGTTTNKDGYFELKIDGYVNENIFISYIGFETEKIPLNELLKNQLNIIELDRSVLSSQTVLVQGTIGEEGVTPLTFSKVTRKDIEENYTVQDLPEYLSYLPSTTFYSEGGNGIGYNYISIRGFGQRRLSISVNGIPQNEPEDHNVYWIDMPDLLESTELIQVSRGAGNGVIGYPSIGGSINIITSLFPDKPKFDFESSIGSYNTRKYCASFSSGLVNKKYSYYVKLSNILTSGYRDNSSADMKSYHVSAVRYDEKLTTQINVYGGPLEDHLVYTGLPKFAVNDKDLRKENLSYWEADENEYTYKLKRRPEEIENFSQPHFELLNEYKVNDDITFNSALFLILGDGFFDYDGSWSVDYDDYLRLKANGFDSTMIPTNALIRAQVENKQYGWIPRLNIKHDNGNLIIGSEIRIHNSVHWGSINYAENLPAGISKDYRYYYYEGSKDIFTLYANESYELNDKVNLLAELQLAYHKYAIENERYLDNEFDIDDVYLNPRFGANYKLNDNLSSYFSFARVTREPRLKDYYDAAESSGGEVPQFASTNNVYDFDDPLVKPEIMNSFELGATYSSNNYSFTANAFYMLFNDEIANNGQTDRFGQPVTGNLDKSIHTGIELSGVAKFAKHFELVVNGAYSSNTISEGSTFVSYGNGEVGEIDLKDNRISGFPDLTFNAILKFNYEKFFAQFSAKYVGEFYSDNYDENIKEYLNRFPGFIDYTDNKVDAYFVGNLFASYEIKPNDFFKTIKAFVQVNNLFDNLYASYAIGKEFFPAAERNVLAGLKLGL
ncbi:MAG: TonB-dependent receptor [Ignavibacteria bacterium]|jgi:iron complex outermembrane receptor protein